MRKTLHSVSRLLRIAALGCTIAICGLPAQHRGVPHGTGLLFAPCPPEV